MANNISIKDSTGTAQTLLTTQNASVHIPGHYIQDPTASFTLPTMDAAGRAGFVSITDGTNKIGVQQFHSSDNQVLGTFYGVATGGITQILNVNGNLDRSRGVAGDQLIGTGIPLDVSMTAQLFPPTFCTSTLANGANRVLNVPSTSNIKVGSVVQVELSTSAVVEWCRVNAVVANTSITVDNLANSHTQPYAVFPILFNLPRDAGAEQDLATGSGATLAVDYNFDGTVYQRARNAFGLGVYTDTSASNVAAGNNVAITTAGTPPTLAAGQTLPVLIIDSANSQQELAIAIATNPGGKTITFQTLAAAYNGSVTPLQLRAPTKSLLTAPQNFNGWGLAADLAVLFSGLDTNNVAQYSVEKDCNAAGLSPTQGAAGATGMDADVNYGIFRTFASLPALTDKQMTPLQVDPAGTLKVGIVSPGTFLEVSSTGGAAANNCTLAGSANKMTYITGFDITGLGATSASTIAITVTGLTNTLTYYLNIPAGTGTAVTPMSIRFNPPLQASAVNTAIVVNVPSFGSGNGTAGANAYGFSL